MVQLNFEDLGTHAKSFQSPEGEKPLSCPHNFLGVFRPLELIGDVDTNKLSRNLKFSTCSTTALSM